MDLYITVIYGKRMTFKLADPGKGVTLEAFIADNDKLLSALAVFSALVVLSDSLPSNFFRYVLTLIFLLGMILVWLELYFKLPKEQSMRLFLFQYILLWGATGIITYCIYKYRFISNIVLFLPTSLIVFGWALGSILPIIRKIKPLRRIFGIDDIKKALMHKIVRGFSLFILLIISLWCGLYLSFGINLFFEILNHSKI